MIKIAVAGCGYWGPNIIRSFHSLPNCHVKAVCDKAKDRLTHIGKIYPNTKTTCSYEDLLQDEEIDAIAIATPVRFHYTMAKESLLAGKHTFVEKPMATSAKECKELIRIAAEKKLALMVGHTFVYSESVKKIKEIVDSRDLGDVLYISSRRCNLGLYQTDINVAWDLAPHDISIILHILNQMPTSVNCQGKAHVNKKIEDVTNMTLNYSNGGFATIQSSWLDPNKVREMTFVGSKRMLVYNDIESMEKIKIYDKRVETPPHYDTFADFQYSYHYGDSYCPYVKQKEPLLEEISHFLDCISNGTKPESSGKEALDVIEILEAASKSLKNGGGQVSVSS
ncbi:MAG: Gfo/Idh/MocA family oxidoreductase [Desulfobacteraceae bacterium]|nr:Gfo/Idh/MocA family oxidoreductase [Desulfobacteraceae bacterium]